MSKLLEEMKEETRKEAKKETIIAMAKKMLGDGSFTAQKISEISGLSIEEIENLKLNLSN